MKSIRIMDADTKLLMAQLEELKSENQRLKNQQGDADSQKLVITESDYNGYPTLTFQRGSKKPFRMGLKKIQAVFEGREAVEKFIQKHGDPANSENPTLEEQI